MEKQKECFKCKKTKVLSEFYKHPDMPDGTVNKCKDCNKKENKQNWHLHIEEKREYDLNRHRYSIQRLFNHKYYMIKARSTIKRVNNYTCYGREFLSKKEWNDWCYTEKPFKEFMNIYNNWVKSGFDRKLTPSIDRINNLNGYVVGNLQWLTLSENCHKHTK